MALPLLLLVLLSLAGCSREPPEEAPPGRLVAAPPDSSQEFQGREYERNIVFLTARSDSALLVPWLLRARTLPGGVHRQARGFLARGEEWEPFLSETWETPPTRTPWRLLPRGRMRLVVGENDGLERLVFEEGPRQLEVALGAALAEWTGPRGEVFRLMNGSLVLSSAPVPGFVLDMSRARRARDPEGGDWGVLLSGDSLQVVLHAPEAMAVPTPGTFRGWARLHGQELEWPDLRVTWGEMRAFQRARRDVPVEWIATSADGDVMAELQVRTAQIEAAPGEGPQLPVEAIFEVEGAVRIGESSYPVRGLLRHFQP
jgi:predicted small lipoprotein YifL